MTFLDFCRAQGIIIDSTPPIGIWKRYKTIDKPSHKNGAVKYMGDHGFVRNWATDSEPNVWQQEGPVTPAKPIDLERIKAQRDRERQYRVQAIKSARQFWNKCRPLSLPHPYIANKGLMPLGCAGVRTYDGLLVIPVMLGDSLISIQTITHDGVKKFWPGAPVKAGACILHRPRSVVTAICEGFATGLAVFQSVRTSSVIVAFDAGNMIKVADRIRPTGSVVVVADNDHKTMVKRGVNPGIDAARNVSDLLGCGVYYPEGIEGSDAADALKEWGEGGSRRLERQILGKAKYVMGAV